MGAGRRDHRKFPQALWTVAPVLRIAEVDGKALQTFDGLRYLHAANRGLHDVLDVPHAHHEAGSRLPVDVDLDEASPDGPLGVGRCRAINSCDRVFDFNADLLDDAKIGPGDLDPDRS